MTDLAPSGRAPLKTVCQIGGSALRIDRQTLLDLVRTSPHFADLVMRFRNAMLVQVSYTALSHGAFKVENRLARWLLMIHDRIEGDGISTAKPREVPPASQGFSLTPPQRSMTFLPTSARRRVSIRKAAAADALSSPKQRQPATA